MSVSGISISIPVHCIPFHSIVFYSILFYTQVRPIHYCCFNTGLQEPHVVNVMERFNGKRSLTKQTKWKYFKAIL